MEDGFAYPVSDGRENFYGLTKREYFAAHAPEVPDWYLNNNYCGTIQGKLARIAKWRWEYADAMIAGRGE